MEKLLKFLKKYYLAFIITFVCFALDLFTKFLATKSLYADGVYNQTTVIDGFFYFTYTRNTGGAWSMFSGNMWFFIIITIIALAAFVYFLSDFDIKVRPWYSIGFAMMLGGTLGNFYERLVNGYVTDFFDFIIFGYDYPIFNVADICLVIGVILLIIQLIFFSDKVTIFDRKRNILKENKENKELEDNNKEEDNKDSDEKTPEDKEVSNQ